MAIDFGKITAKNLTLAGINKNYDHETFPVNSPVTGFGKNVICTG
jgi:hypothetical protein